jgi:molecular chaperone GrpE
MKKKRDKDMKDNKEKDMLEEEIKEESINEEVETDSSDGDIEVMTKQKLKERISELEVEKAEAANKYLRTLAEFDNFRKRSAQERINWIRNATEGLVMKLCEVVDDFERALQNSPNQEKKDSFHRGIEAIYLKFNNILKAEGVKKIEAEEVEFNPMMHEAIAYTPAQQEKDTIVSVIQNGYMMNDKVIRPAKVAVSSGFPEGDEDESEENQEK